MEDHRLEELIRTIRAAFTGTERGDGTSISEAHVIDSYGSEEARRDARHRDPGGAWEDLAGEHIEQGAFAMAFLDGQGLRYYLPAFMVRSLTHPGVSDLPETTIELLFHPPEVDERLEPLSPEQRRAVCLFLRYFASEEMEVHVSTAAGRRALAGGWSLYCD